LNTNAVGFTALHLLAKPHHKWTREQLDDVLGLMQALLEQRALPDSEQPGTGRTPLSLAATAGQYELAALLLRYGADPANPERDGRTAIERCRSGAQVPMARVLEEARLRWISKDPAAVNQRARRR
jgi:ankyrin repeat protein